MLQIDQGVQTRFCPVATPHQNTVSSYIPWTALQEMQSCTNARKDWSVGKRSRNQLTILDGESE